MSTVTQSAKSHRRFEPGFVTILHEHRHNWRQIYLLARTDLKKTYKGAFLGAGWAVVKPLFTLFIYWFAFEYGIRRLVFHERRHFARLPVHKEK